MPSLKIDTTGDGDSSTKVPFQMNDMISPITGTKISFEGANLPSQLDS
jgi:hypothetical protein